MKIALRLTVLTALLLLPLQSTFAASFNCAKAKTWAEKTICNTKQLSNLDELLDASYKKALASTSAKSALKAAQTDWLVMERDTCEDVDCLKSVYTSRIAVLNEMIADAADFTTSSSTQTAAGWYKATATPNLVVRSKPDVTGTKLGNVPTGGKLKVLATTKQTDFIGGRNGTWVKVEWQGKEAYAFDAFLEKLSAQQQSSNNTQPPASSTGKTLEGVITSYECGDNCYLTITDKQGDAHSGLCTAPLCDSWNEIAEMPASYQNKKVKVGISIGKQYDAAGNVMGEMDAFETITLLK